MESTWDICNEETQNFHHTVDYDALQIFTEIEQALRRVLWAAQLKYDSDADKLLINC